MRIEMRGGRAPGPDALGVARFDRFTFEGVRGTTYTLAFSMPTGTNVCVHACVCGGGVAATRPRERRACVYVCVRALALLLQSIPQQILCINFLPTRFRPDLCPEPQIPNFVRKGPIWRTLVYLFFRGFPGWGGGVFMSRQS